MKIQLHEIKVKDLVQQYEDKDEDGIFAYGGKLDVRPPYQRNFVYNDKERNAVIDTVQHNFPLNIMYWVKKDNGNFEILDGQQRTISICQYVNGEFSFNKKNFFNLTSDEKDEILNYKLMVYFCEGTTSEKLAWFKVVNIAGEKLYDQELRNSVYSGPWLTDAKRYFSKTNGPAYAIGNKLLKGHAIRQDYLETALKWISDDNIDEYMATHQHDNSASDLWLYFSNVINWVNTLFINYHSEMKGQPWGFLYNKYGNNSYDPKAFDNKIDQLMLDEDVESNKGIYPYLFDNQEKHLSLRAFPIKMKKIAYKNQNGICVKCKQHFEFNEMEGDHITPWSEGGHTTLDNLQMLCKRCNREKSNK